MSDINLLKFNRIEIRKPYFDPNPQKSTTQNHEWRQGLMVIFTDNNGREFIYMPKWADLEIINTGKGKVEIINKRLCAENSKEVNK